MYHYYSYYLFKGNTSFLTSASTLGSAIYTGELPPTLQMPQKHMCPQCNYHETADELCTLCSRQKRHIAMLKAGNNELPKM